MRQMRRSLRQRSSRFLHRTTTWWRRLARHPDPLVEASNWAALLIGTHLPFWPLYVWWSAGAEAFPSALLTVGLAPLFIALPLLARRHGLLGRIAMLVLGIANTVFTIWILGYNSGTVLFLGPCAALAAILFRRRERWLMLSFTTLPLLVWYALQSFELPALHHYNAAAAHSLFILNIISVSVLISAFGWLQTDTYRREERQSRSARPK